MSDCSRQRGFMLPVQRRWEALLVNGALLCQLLEKPH